MEVKVGAVHGGVLLTPAAEDFSGEDIEDPGSWKAMAAVGRGGEDSTPGADGVA